MLQNGAAQIEETATQLAERLRMSTSRQLSMPAFSQLRGSVVSGTQKKLATATQPQFPREITDFKQATGFQIRTN
jgi:hypothetical protein